MEDHDFRPLVLLRYGRRDDPEQRAVLGPVAGLRERGGGEEKNNQDSHPRILPADSALGAARFRAAPKRACRAR